MKSKYNKTFLMICFLLGSCFVTGLTRAETCDEDGDGVLRFGSIMIPSGSPDMPDTVIECAGTDCDDGNAAIHPGAVETENGLDDDCDGSVDEGFIEICSDGVDNNGDGLMDCDDPDCSTYPDCNCGTALIVNSTLDASDNNLDDDCCVTADGVCTLRAALEELATSGGKVDFLWTTPQTIELTLGDLFMGSESAPATRIDGADLLTVDGGGASLFINDRDVSSLYQLQNLTLTNFREVVIASFLCNIIHVTFSNFYGGESAIRNTGFFLSMENVTIISNAGRGVYNDGGWLGVNASTITSNRSDAGCGGGVLNRAGAVFLSASTVDHNVTEYSGGGICNTEGGSLSLLNSTVGGNQAMNSGGGIANEASSTAQLYNVTLADNVANLDGEGLESGGGIFNAGGSFELANSLVMRNQIYRVDSFVEQNFFNEAGTITSLGYNIFGSHSEAVPALVDGDVSDVTTGLADSLANNGGSTLTYAILTGSPAINGGNPAGCGWDDAGLWTPIEDDQRLYPRPSETGERCDVGAVEYDVHDKDYDGRIDEVSSDDDDVDEEADVDEPAEEDAGEVVVAEEGPVESGTGEEVEGAVTGTLTGSEGESENQAAASSGGGGCSLSKVSSLKSQVSSQGITIFMLLGFAGLVGVRGRKRFLKT